jgi:hypothetical protein
MADGINAIGNLPGKVDSNNQLLVALGSGSTLPNDIDVDAGTGTAEAGIGGVLTVSTTSAQTTAVTTEEDLWTYSLPANTLSANNYGVRITVAMSSASNANNKTYRVYFGATVVAVRGAVADNNHTTVFTITVWRTGASAQKAIAFAVGTSTAATTKTTPAADTTAAITIKATGQNGTASAGDVVFEWAMVEFLRAGS